MKGSKNMINVMKFAVVLLMIMACYIPCGAGQDEGHLSCMNVPDNQVTSCVRSLARGAKLYCCDGLTDVNYTCLCTAQTLIGITSPQTLISMAASCGVPLPTVCNSAS